MCCPGTPTALGRVVCVGTSGWHRLTGERSHAQESRYCGCRCACRRPFKQPREHFNDRLFSRWSFVLSVNITRVPCLSSTPSLSLSFSLPCFCCSHWQQDVEEADTSAICNRTLVSPRSRPVASRESFLRSLKVSSVTWTATTCLPRLQKQNT